MEKNQKDILADAYLTILFQRPQLNIVSIGSCDGVIEDAFCRHLMYSDCEVSGHCFECNQQLSRLCAKFTGAFAPRILQHNVAIWNTDERVDYYFLPISQGYGIADNGAFGDGWAIGCGGVGEIPREFAGDEWKELVRHCKVPCMTWKTACESYCIDTFDALNIDVEGKDIDVFSQIDLCKHQVSWAKVELRHCGEGSVVFAREMQVRYEDTHRALFGRYDLYLISRELPELRIER